MKLKVGDFLIKRKGDDTEIAVVNQYYQKKDYYELYIIGCDRVVAAYPYRSESYLNDWELERDGWTKLDSVFVC